jgi:hypothetical protein
MLMLFVVLDPLISEKQDTGFFGAGIYSTLQSKYAMGYADGSYIKIQPSDLNRP